jgi:hypothetical protein
MFPLPFTCSHEHYLAGVEDDHGNDVPGWAAPVDVACFWWLPTSAEPTVPDSGGVRTAVDVSLVVDSSVVVDPRDVFTVDGRRFEVIGLPKDYDHGPFGFTPGRRVVELKWVG